MHVNSFVNVTGNHRKFYVVRADLTNKRVTLVWGRIGTMGQERMHRFLDREAVREFVTKVCDLRIKLGYTQVAYAAL